MAGSSSNGLTITRPTTRQTTIPTRVVIKESVHLVPEVTPIPVATSAAPMLEQVKKKRHCSDKEADFLGTNSEEPVKKVLKVLPPKVVAVAVVHTKYWTKAWRDHTYSYTVEDLVAATNACIVRALSTSIQLEGLVNNLRAKNIDLA